MGCSTIYIVRERDGSLWWDGSKWGQLDFAAADELARHLDALPRQPAGEGLVIDGWWCRGWFVDRARKLARVYPCGGDTYDAFLLERRLRGAAGWRGWDVAVAWEKIFEVSALAGLAASEDEHRARLDGWAGCTEATLLTRHSDRARFPHRWDPDAEELRYAWYHHDGVDISVIDASGRVRDYGFDDGDVLFEALGYGPRLLDALRAAAPCPHVITSHKGAVIDEQQRSVRYWIDSPVAPATLAELGRRWPGWTVERERAGLAGHLQRTGRVEDLRDWSQWGEKELPYPSEDPPRALRFISARLVSDEEVAPAPIPADEAQLLAAVYADPASDVAREVYADLLLAKGDRRGALINVQCELSRMVRAGESSARRRALEEEEARLARWYGQMLVPGARVRRVSRGFVEAVDVHDTAALLENKILRDFPTIDDIEISSMVGAAEIRALDGEPGITRLRKLTIRPAAGGSAEYERSLAALRERMGDALVVR